MANPPLAGRRILLPARWSPELGTAIVAAGGEVDEIQLLDRRPTPSPALDALPGRCQAGELDWLVITSAFTLLALEQLGHPLGQWCPPQLALAAVGPTSASAVHHHTGRVPLQPSAGTGGAALAAVFPDGDGRVAIPGAAHQSPALRTGLTGKGWQVEEIAVYRTLPVEQVSAELRGRWRSGGYHALVVTSASVADAAAGLLGPGPVVAVGQASATAAGSAGFRPVLTSPSAIASDLVGTLTELLN